MRRSLNDISRIVRRRLVAGTLVAGTTSALIGCASTTSTSSIPGDRVIAAASAADNAALLDRVKSLAGNWKVVAPGGEEGTITFAVSSNGSAVREVMFPGHPHEMTNMYHMDGSSLIMTHYCAVGNQPRMRARAGSGDAIDLRLDSVTNRHAGAHVMAGLRIEFVDANHIRQVWSVIEDGALKEGPAFELTRAN